MSRFFDQDGFEADVDEDARQDSIDARRARRHHWCSECHGKAGGPCDVEPESQSALEDEAAQ